MRRGYFRIGITLLIVFGIAIGYQAFGLMVLLALSAITGTGVSHFSLFTQIVVNGIAQSIVMLGGTIFLIKLFRQDPVYTLRLAGFHETPVMAYILVLPLIASSQIVGSMIANLWEHALMHLPTLYAGIKDFENQLDELTKGSIVEPQSIVRTSLVFISIAIIPALAEETLFRGFMQTNIEISGKQKPRPHVAIIWASIAFAFMHLEPIKFPGLLVLGLTLGWVSWRSGNLLVGSVGHAANNGAIVIALLLMPQGAPAGAAASILDSELPSVSFSLAALTVSIPIFALCLYLFYRVTLPLKARDFSMLFFEPEPIPGSVDQVAASGLANEGRNEPY